ncbi:MarR family winged helix-turn-helix transcriptional regulator [Ferrovibrio terrae]|uniref:MarR family winged helix-turn-helix transcriptional regulator n=1 Tax=Ferrovibrio terrae TaxID=2594003 RepID=UPI0031380C22
MFTLPPPMPDGRELCLCFQLRAAARRASALYTSRLAPIGLGLPQYSLVGMAAACEKQNGRPPSITELAAALDLDRSTLSRNLKPMIAAGLVEVAPAGQGRAKLVRATREGRAAYRAGVALWRAAQDEAQAALGAQFQGLMQGLETTIAGLPAAAGSSVANDL